MATARKKNTAVTKQQTGGSVVPSFMEEDVGKGAEDLGSDAIEIPRIKLLQKISPELDDNEDLRAGQWFHTVSEDELGDELRFVPCYLTRAFILFRPRKDGGGVLARAIDGVNWDASDTEFEVKLDNGKTVKWNTGKNVKSSGLDAWGSSDPDDAQSQPAATAMINVACMLPDFPELSPCVLTFQRSGFKVGKKLAGNLRTSRLPSFGRYFMLSSVKAESDAGPYLMPRCKADGVIEDRGYFEQCKEAYENFKRMGLHVKDLEDEGYVEGESSDGAESEDY